MTSECLRPDSHEDLGVEEDEGEEGESHCQHQSSPVCVIPVICTELDICMVGSICTEHESFIVSSICTELDIFIVSPICTELDI